MKLQHILILSMLLTATASHARTNIRQYAASMEQANWAVTNASALKCELSHHIPNFGEARFSSSANKELNLIFELKMIRLPDDYGLAKVMSVPQIGRAHV